jgi:uncharacterized protein with HEPN domain
MSKRDAALLIEDMRAAMDKIARYTAGMERAAFLVDEKTIDAVVRNVEIIGEASRQVPDEFKARHPALPWAQMVGLRNRIVHDYAGIDLELIWEIVQHSLPDLRVRLEKLA